MLGHLFASHAVIDTEYGEKIFSRNLPANLNTKQDIFYVNKQYNCPALYVYKFSAINMLPDSTLFKGIFPLRLSFLYFKMRLIHHNVRGIIYILLKWRKKKLKAKHYFLVIHDAWTQNYYHWITQALPRLILAQQLGDPFILLLPKNHQSEFHLASLKFMEINSWQTLELKEQYFSIFNLLYPGRDIQIGDYNDDLIRILHGRLSRVQRSSISKKIFIRRKSRNQRIILNEEEVLETFRFFEFEIIEFEGLSFEEQLLLVGKAKILAGVHGAGLTNMIFMPLQSIVFELTTRMDGENYYYYTLSNALSHRYYYQLCETDKPSTTVQEANLVVDIKKLKENILLMSSE